MGGAGDDAADKVEKSTGKMDNALKKLSKAADVAFTAIVAGAGLVAVALIKAFKDGIDEIEESEVALNRLAAVAGRTGQSFEALQASAEKLSARSLIEFDVALQGVADLVQKGFKTDEIDKMAVALEDIAAAAGGNVQENFQTLTNAIVSGRAAGADLERMLPGLKGAMKEFGDETKTAEAKQALLNVILEQGERMMGAAAEKANTLQGQMQILQIKIKDASQAFAEGLLPLLNQTITAMTSTTGSTMTLSDWAGILAETIGTTLRDMVLGSIQAWTSLTIVLDLVKLRFNELDHFILDWVQSSISAFKKWTEAFLKLPGGAALVGDSLKQLTAIEKQLNDQEEILYKNEFALRMGIDESAKKWNELETAMGKSLPTLEQQKRVTGDLQQTVVGLTDAQKKLLQGFMDQLAPADALANKYLELAAVGVNVNDFVKVYGDQIIAATAAQKAFNIPLSEMAKILSSLTAGDVDFSGITPGSSVSVVDYANAWMEATDAVEEFSDEFAGTVSVIDFAKSHMAEMDTQLEVVKDSTVDWISVLQMLGQELGGLGGLLAGSIARGMDTFKGLMDQFTKDPSTNMTGLSNKWAAGIGAMGSALSALGSNMDGVAGQIVSGAGAIAQGFAMGGPWGAAIAAIGVMINVLTQLGQHDWAEDVEHQVSALLPGLKLSTQMMERLAKEAEELGDSMVPVFLNLKSIIDDVGGLSGSNIDTFISALRDGFSMLERGQIDIQQLGDVIDDVFAEMAEASKDSLGLISAGMREIIALAQQFGVESQAITDFINSELSNAISGFNDMVSITAGNFDTFRDRQLKMIRAALEGDAKLLKQFDDMISKGATLNDVWAAFIDTLGQGEIWGKASAGWKRFQGQIKDFQTVIMADFNALIAQGASPFEAIEQLGPGFEQIIQMMEELGMDATGAFKELKEMFDLTQDFPKAFAGMDAVNQQLISLANIGKLDKDTFKALEDQAKRSFRVFTKDGKISNAELQAMAPTLSILAKLSDEYGITLDKSTQEMIDLAEAQGLLDTDTPADLATVMQNEVVPAIKDVTAELRVLINTLLGIPDVTTTVTTEYVTTGNPPPGSPDDPNNPPPPGGGGGGGGAEPASEEFSIARATSGSSFNVNIQLYGTNKQDAEFVSAIIVDKLREVQNGSTPFDLSRSTRTLRTKI